MWMEARALAEADTAEEIERTLALSKPQGMLRDLEPDARIRLDALLEEIRANPSSRGRRATITYLRYLPEPTRRVPRVNGARGADGRRARTDTKAIRAVAMLRADPEICYADVAVAVGSTRKYVQVLAGAEGLQRGTRGRGPAPSLSTADRREQAGIRAHRREFAEILLRRYPSASYGAIGREVGASKNVVEGVARRIGLERAGHPGRPRRVPAVPARYDHAAARAGRRSASKASPARVRVPGAVRKLRADRTTIRLLADNGHSHEAIATRLEIPVETVRFHLRTPRRGSRRDACAIVGAAMRTQRVRGD